MKKLVAYLTIGYPNLFLTEDLIGSISEYVDILELGIPFSDPVADGEIIEKANGLALKNGIKFQDVLNIAEKTEVKKYLMGYFNSFYHRGIEKVLKEFQNRNIAGAIIPDLPFEETKIYQPLFDKNNSELIPFIAPTDSAERIETILKNNQASFIYLVAYAGITGSGRDEVLTMVIENIRKISNQEVYIGFGVDENTAKKKIIGVDGVIVGTAFVKILIDNSLSNSEKIKKITEKAKKIKYLINE